MSTGSGAQFEMYRLVGLLWAVVWAASSSSVVADGHGYDNPGMGSTPCLVMTSLKAPGKAVGAGDAAEYMVDATLENVCGRTLDTEICVIHAVASGDPKRNCATQMVRPESTIRIRQSDAAGRVTGLEFSWRYLSVQ